MSSGMVCCAPPVAAEAGIAMLDRGGNAIDAAVAAAFAQGVVDPLNASIGGFGVAQIRPTGATESIIVAFHATAPGAARPDMFEVTGDTSLEPLASGTYPVKKDANQVGYLAPCVPGVVRGLTDLVSTHCRLDLTALLSPAIDLCEAGWVVTQEHWNNWTQRQPTSRLNALARFLATPAAAAIYTRNAELIGVGATIVNPDYSRSLRTIAEQGADAFYSGELAQAIAADFAANGGVLSLADLESYSAEIPAPLSASYRDYRISTAPPPAGGLVVLETLRLLADTNLSGLGHNTAAYVATVSEAFGAAFDYMRRFSGDPAFVNVSPRETRPEGGEIEETTHVTAVDAEGNWAAITHTLGAASGVVTPGLGFIFNGAMHRFDPVPGRPNSIAPGKRRLSGMSPTIVWSHAEPVLVLGGAGGHSIIAGIVQVILNFVEFGMDPQAAVSAPRFHCEGGKISVEARFAGTVVRELIAAGHEVDLVPASYDRVVGASIHAIGRTGAGFAGGADPRQGGVPMWSGG
jgi:gamma-glutamyltranspeptidase/glutathione hydrolase